MKSEPSLMNLPIHDLVVRSLAPSELPGRSSIPIVRFEDHLLRRFGLAEYLRAAEDHTPVLRLQTVADELWALLEGSVEFLWHDLRQGSPSRGTRVRVFSASPTLVLVPFGVAFGFRVPSGEASLLRLATHSDIEGPPAQLLPWEEEG